MPQLDEQISRELSIKRACERFGKGASVARLLVLVVLAIACTRESTPRAQERDPSSLFAADTLIAPEADATQVRLAVAVVEIALLEAKYLFRIPTGRVDDELVAAVRTFQREQGFAVSGQITNEELSRFGVLRDAPDIMLPPGTFFFHTTREGRVNNATWFMTSPEDETLAAPLNTSEIRCDRESRSCDEYTAGIVRSPMGAMLNLTHTRWEVVEWEWPRIVAKSEAACAELELQLDFVEHSGQTLRRPKLEPGCGGIAANRTELRQPFDVYWWFTQKWKRERNAIESQSFRSAVDSLVSLGHSREPVVPRALEPRRKFNGDAERRSEGGS